MMLYNKRDDINEEFFHYMVIFVFGIHVSGLGCLGQLLDG